LAEGVTAREGDQTVWAPFEQDTDYFGAYGRFAWAGDPEGHRFELWGPPS
jgi:hypothetical protein